MGLGLGLGLEFRVGSDRGGREVRARQRDALGGASRGERAVLYRGDELVGAVELIPLLRVGLRLRLRAGQAWGRARVGLGLVRVRVRVGGRG